MNIYRFTSVSGKKSFKTEGETEPEAYKNLTLQMFMRMKMRRPGVLVGKKAKPATCRLISREEYNARIAEAEALERYSQLREDLQHAFNIAAPVVMQALEEAAVFGEARIETPDSGDWPSQSDCAPDPIEPGGGHFGGGGASGDW